MVRGGGVVGGLTTTTIGFVGVYACVCGCLSVCICVRGSIWVENRGVTEGKRVRGE